MTIEPATMNNESPRFEDVYARAPFSELIRIVLTAAKALVGYLGRPSPRSPAPAGRGAR